MRFFLFYNLLYFILSSFAWPTAYLNDQIITLLGIVLYVCYSLKNRISINIDTNSCFIITSFLLYSAYNIFLGSYSAPLRYIPPLLLCFFSNEVKRELLKYITKWYGILMMLSMCIFILLFIIDLPSLGILNHYIYEPYENYFLYLKPYAIEDQFRFEAFFFEPGHCAMVGSMLLFAQRYKLKNNPWLIPTLLSVLLSLSLAGYVLLVIGLLLQYSKNIKFLLYFFIIVLSAYIFVVYIWEDGKNPVNELIVARLEFDKKSGITGNNRSYMFTDRYFSEAKHDGDIWCGIGIEKFNELFNHSIAGAGYKIFLLQYGLIGMLLLGFIFYGYSLTSTLRNRHFAQLFLFFIAIAFLQRCYTFWFSWQLSYICSIVINSKPKNKKRLTDQITTT